MPQYQPDEAGMITNAPPQDLEGVINSTPVQESKSMMTIGLETSLTNADSIDSFAHQEEHTVPMSHFGVATLVLETPAKTIALLQLLSPLVLVPLLLALVFPPCRSRFLCRPSRLLHFSSRSLLSILQLYARVLFANVTPDKAQHYEDDGVEEEGFDEMHVGFLHNLQVVKD
jgi:hypothetical protein